MTLVNSIRVSRRFNQLSGDSQVWKSAFYDRFVLPRASRIPGIKQLSTPGKSLIFSSRASKWLDDEGLVRRGAETNWKREYKLRHNWAQGSCGLSEIKILEQPPLPPLLLRLHHGVVITVESTAGLRAWSLKGEKKLLASKKLPSFRPTALAINNQDEGKDCAISIGFENGSYSVYQLYTEQGTIAHRYSHPPSSNGLISALSFSSPYLLSMTKGQLLSLYDFGGALSSEAVDATLTAPRLISSLKSHTVWPPLSISLRTVSKKILASVVFSQPTFLSGWTVGIQELTMSPNGAIEESRLASAIDQGFHPLSPASFSASPQTDQTLPKGAANLIFDAPMSRPTTLSYNHPYLLASHQDNTLTLYLVTSSARGLSISPGNRLWGHTSSVSSAHVGGRGKAVSVTSRGDELRVWELEGGISSNASRRRLASGQLSVRVLPEKKTSKTPQNLDVISRAISRRGTGLGLAFEYRTEETSRTGGWVGFDDEKVVVLREKERGSQDLVVYDFT